MQKRHSPEQPPEKFAAKKYYEFPGERVRQKSEAVALSGGGNVLAPAASDQGRSDALPSSSIDDILSGGGFLAGPVVEERALHMSARAILESTVDGKKCNFQGVLVACDAIPRDVNIPEDSPRKRKATPAEMKAADIVCVDKTGG